jgi:hypothetical protein
MGIAGNHYRTLIHGLPFLEFRHPEHAVDTGIEQYPSQEIWEEATNWSNQGGVVRDVLAYHGDLRLVDSSAGVYVVGKPSSGSF